MRSAAAFLPPVGPTSATLLARPILHLPWLFAPVQV